MNELLEKLYQKEDLSKEETLTIFEKMVIGDLNEISMTAALLGLKLKGESYIEIAGAAQALLNKANKFETPHYEFGDIVGTGGDKSNTINVSTLSSFVAASMGVKIAKHGNRSVSSKCGSFDILEELKINFNQDASKLREQLDDHGLTFLFAPLFHSGIKNVMPVRTTLKTRTIFNILGPLINPARPTFQMVGVYKKDLILPMAKVLQNLSLKNGLVVYGNGLDEIAPHGKTHFCKIENEKITEGTLSPKDFGFDEFSLEKIKGGDKKTNLEYSLNILSGKGTTEQKKMIAMNVSPLLVMNNSFSNYKEAANSVMQILETDAPYKLAQKLS